MDNGKTEKKKTSNKKALIAVAAILILAGAFFVCIKLVLPRARVNRAMSLIEEGNYDSSYELLIKSSRYDLMWQSLYDRTVKALNEDNIDGAKEIYEAWAWKGSFNKKIYDQAIAYMQVGESAKAVILLEGLEDSPYEDWEEKLNEARANAHLEAIQDTVNQLADSDVGDYVLFGSYEQDVYESDGKEAIEWLVLSKEDDRLLLVSKYALDAMPYHDTKISENIIWESCTLRAWLNNEFLNSAFTEEEQSMIPSVTVAAHDNPSMGGLSSGNDTEDKVFILSYQEAEEYFSSDADRICKATAYAQGFTMPMEDSLLEASWWLRTRGETLHHATFVDQYGRTNMAGQPVNEGISRYNTQNEKARMLITIRPAIWVDITP